MSGDERVRRIGELICKGIICSPSLRFEAADAQVRTESVAEDPDQRIVDYLRRYHAASPS